MDENVMGCNDFKNIMEDYIYNFYCWVENNVKEDPEILWCEWLDTFKEYCKKVALNNMINKGAYEFKPKLLEDNCLSCEYKGENITVMDFYYRIKSMNWNFHNTESQRIIPLKTTFNEWVYRFIIYCRKPY